MLAACSAANCNFELSYGECCGAPAGLLWEINQQPIGGGGNNVTDAASTLPLLAVGLGGLAAIARRMKK
jgi:hypothetical protein